jgi:hypothetical protein
LRTERPVPGPLASRWTSQQSARGTLTRRRRRKLRAAEPARSSGGRRGAYRTSELAQVAPPGVASPRAGKPTLGFPLRWRTALRSKDDEHSIRRRNTSTSSTSARRTGRWAGCTRIGFGPANRGRAHSSRRCAHGWTSRRTQQAGVCARPCESPGSTANRRAGTDPASSEPSVCADGGVEAAAPAAASKLVRATSRGEVISSPGKPGDGAWPQASVLRRRGGVSRPQTSPPPHREPPDEPGSARCRGRSHRRTGTGSVLIGLEPTSVAPRGWRASQLGCAWNAPPPASELTGTTSSMDAVRRTEANGGSVLGVRATTGQASRAPTPWSSMISGSASAHPANRTASRTPNGSSFISPLPEPVSTFGKPK